MHPIRSRVLDLGSGVSVGLLACDQEFQPQQFRQYDGQAWVPVLWFLYQEKFGEWSVYVEELFNGRKNKETQYKYIAT